MPKIRCTCDQVIWLGEIPSPYQLMMITDTELDQLWPADSDNMRAEEFYKISKIVVQCPACKRLHVFWNGFDKPQVIYCPE